MKRCCRDHDLVARISGDEFAVVFWEKEGPRSRAKRRTIPRRASLIRPRRLRTISPAHLLAGFSTARCHRPGRAHDQRRIAVYPFDAQTPEALIEAADRALMFDAKKGGKNTIFLVGDQPGPPNNLTLANSHRRAGFSPHVPITRMAKISEIHLAQRRISRPRIGGDIIPRMHTSLGERSPIPLSKDPQSARFAAKTDLKKRTRRFTQLLYG